VVGEIAGFANHLSHDKECTVGKVIMVLSDALRYDAAVAGMGFLGHLVEIKQASLYKVIGELPSMSRPMYETTHTGVPVSVHGIVSNQVVRRSRMPNIFQLAVQAGMTTAAAAYCWFSELYNRAPYDLIDDREVDDESLLIQHGRFYIRDEYPDLELFCSAATLVRKFNPDYLLVHPMGMDYIGETFGADTSQYRNQAIRQDAILSNLIAEWMELGYNILVTGDHGINADKSHGGTRPEMREVPLFLIQAGVSGKGDTGEVISQLRIAPTICHLLDLPIPETMKHPPLEV
jgi:predicted AlkP superfamily pyrophosphatase or phosphodiesterase